MDGAEVGRDAAQKQGGAWHRGVAGEGTGAQPERSSLRPCPLPLQVRPGDAVQFKQLTIQEAYLQRLTTDKKVELLCWVARGAAAAADAEAALAAFNPEVPEAPPTEAVLRVIPAAGGHPGAQVRHLRDLDPHAACAAFLG